MRKTAIFPAWGRILLGYRPFLSIEITKECPLKCPGCYAYGPEHLGSNRRLKDLSEWRGDELVRRVLLLVRRHRPIHVSIVGGEPLARYREVTEIISRLDGLGIEVQVVTSAVRPLPDEWRQFSNLHLVVSVDGLSPEHDIRRTPATYDRIIRNIDGHEVIIHCTVIQQFLSDPDYLSRFVETWTSRKGTRKIWFSLFTPQKGESSQERLTEGNRAIAIYRIDALRTRYPKLYAPQILLRGFRDPPASPAECIFAQVTDCISADLSTHIVPCQIGGKPECSECGCIAAAGLASIGNIRLAGRLKVSHVLALSQKLRRRRP